MIGPARRPAFGRQCRQAVQPGDPIVEQEAVYRMQHVGNAGQLCDRWTQQTGLGIVRVDDLVLAAAHLGVEGGSAAGVGDGSDLSLERQIVQVQTEIGQSGLVVDAVSRAGVGCPTTEHVDLTAGGGEADQSPPQQQPGDSVGGHHMGDTQHAYASPACAHTFESAVPVAAQAASASMSRTV